MNESALDQALHDEFALALSQDLANAMKDWLASLEHERGLSANTIDAYARDLRMSLAISRPCGATPRASATLRAWR